VFFLAGLAMFVAIGLGVAVGLAAIDDRVYRRIDLGQLGVPVLGEVPHARRPNLVPGAPV
jgi:capsular polysaccharide biosynthesis protein